MTSDQQSSRASTSPFATPNKEQHENLNDALGSRWSPDDASFLEMEQECPSRIRSKLSRGSSFSPSSIANGRNPFHFSGESSFSSELLQYACGPKQVSLRKKKNGSSCRTKAMIPFIVLIAISAFDRDPSNMKATTMSLDVVHDSVTPSSTAQRQMQIPSKPAYPKPPKCTTNQLMTVRHQIPPEPCIYQHVEGIAYAQKCSLTAATNCPNATWLEDFYIEKQKEYSQNSQSTLSPPPFLGISIGCNKGFDAINTLRMGIYDPDIDKVKWKKAMTSDGSSELHKSVCNQDSAADMFPILESFQASSNLVRPQGEMHCIEPMPQTYHKLLHSAESLGYTQKGFVVTHGAMSKTSGEMLFLTDGVSAGVENIGLDACKRPRFRRYCETVKVYSLAEFVASKVKASENQNINVLSIDVEGFDGDVLLGATSKILERVEYLEFEYNWMGSWKNQHLYDIVEMLDQQANMVCYWAGRDRLWRITDCWMTYYDVHSWSNVACANRVLVPELAAKMEATFQRTLDDETTQWTHSRRVARKIKIWQHTYKDHPGLSLEEDILQQKYI